MGVISTLKKKSHISKAEKQRRYHRWLQKKGLESPPSTVYKAGKTQVHQNTLDAFLETFEWRKVRMEAIKKYGARCQCCGATPKDGIRINVDHIKPRKLYPQLALDLSNLQVLCDVCNHGKGNWDMTDWRSKEEA